CAADLHDLHSFPTRRSSDLPSAVKLFHEWPSPIVVSGFEIGAAMPIPGPRIEHDFAYIQDHPVADAYRAYMKMPYDRPSWDLTRSEEHTSELQSRSDLVCRL